MVKEALGHERGWGLFFLFYTYKTIDFLHICAII